MFKKRKSIEKFSGANLSINLLEEIPVNGSKFSFSLHPSIAHVAGRQGANNNTKQVSL